ncbi:MAG TPA: DUF3592 domain-containing protein [Thermoanaerobaculia bacterium]
MLPTLAPPPRHVPLSLRVLNYFNVFSLVGWVFFGVSMIFFWVFAGNADLSFITFRTHEHAQGKVTKVDTTGASENRSRVMATHYEYSVAGTTLQGKSYTTGSTPDPGDEVPVEYDPDNPKRSRIEGMRRALFGPWVSFVAIFPLIGVLIIIPSMLSGIKRNRLLREGILTTGKLVSKTATNTSVNNNRVYELKFEFMSRDGRRSYATARTSITEKLQDEAEEPLLYDPSDVTRAFMLDELPSRPKTINGELEGRPTAAALAVAFPALILAVHGLVLWLKIVLASR